MLSILVAQSNPSIRKAVSEYLYYEGVAVVSPGSFRGTINALDFYAFDIVLLDPFLTTIDDWSNTGNEQSTALARLIVEKAIKNERKVTIIPTDKDSKLEEYLSEIKSEYVFVDRPGELIAESHLNQNLNKL